MRRPTLPGLGAALAAVLATLLAKLVAGAQAAPGAAWRGLLAAPAAGRRLRAWWAGQPHHVPAVLLLLGAWLVFYGWGHAPPELQADVWNLGGSVGRLLLLTLVVLAYRGAPVYAAALWWCVEDAQVLGCGLLWLLDGPWPTDTGSRCSDRWGVHFALIGLWAGTLAAWVVINDVRTRRPR